MGLSIYDQIGGRGAVDQAVDLFYARVLADDAVNGFFDGADMKQQAIKQKAFLTMVMGGPNRYTGKSLREGHAHLLEKGLNDSHVDVIIAHLGATLKELGVPEELVAQVAAVAEGARDDVLGR